MLHKGIDSEVKEVSGYHLFSYKTTTYTRSRQAHFVPPLLGLPQNYFASGLDRSGHIVDKVMPHFTLAQLKADFLPKLMGGLVLCTDGHINYEYLASQEKINHVVLNASMGERIKDNVFHIQTVNSYHMRLKQWLHRFHGVATIYTNIWVGLDGLSSIKKHANHRKLHARYALCSFSTI